MTSNVSLTRPHKLLRYQKLIKSQAFRSYTGFFTIIWFTWLQTALFDCRFARDSVVERCWKFIQFGVMIGFAAVGSEFRPNEVDSDFKSFRAVSVILLISQLLLAVQYLTILIAVIKRKHKSAVTPLAMIVAIYFITAMVFIGLTFTFRKRTKPSKAYIVWYIALIVESVLITVVALWRRILSFKFSNIVERMGLLTLIILGEGVIGLAKTANKVIYKEGWTASSLYEVTAYTATIFFMWMLYFDYNPRTHYGSIRQQLWALLHYPFHLACVLLPEGFGNMVIWRNIVNDVMAMGDTLKKATSTTTGGEGFLDLGILANGTAKVLKIKPEDMATSPEWADLTVYLEKIKKAGSSSGSLEEMQSAIIEYLVKAVSLVFKGFKIALPESIQRKQGKNISVTETQIDQYTDIFRLVYAYFFGSAAAVVLLYAVFLFLARKKYDKFDIISMFYRVFVAIGLVCATTITFHNASLEKVMLSPWYIPIVPLALGLRKYPCSHLTPPISNKLCSHRRRPSPPLHRHPRRQTLPWPCWHARPRQVWQGFSRVS